MRKYLEYLTLMDRYGGSKDVKLELQEAIEWP
jgi:hypothetical protein